MSRLLGIFCPVIFGLMKLFLLATYGDLGLRMRSDDRDQMTGRTRPRPKQAFDTIPSRLRAQSFLMRL